MATCEECGKSFDTDRGLWIHRAVEHEDEVKEWEESDLSGSFLDIWQQPRYTFILGLLVGVVLVVSVVLSAPAAFQDRPDRIGERTAHHYRTVAPPGVTNELIKVEDHRSGTYAVTLQVVSGSVVRNQTVYVTQDGDYVFESPPSELKTDIAALGEQ